MGPAASIGKPGNTFLAEPHQPLVGGLGTHPETPTQFTTIGPCLNRQFHKLTTQTHGVSRLPRHGSSPDPTRSEVLPMSPHPDPLPEGEGKQVHAPGIPASGAGFGGGTARGGSAIDTPAESTSRMPSSTVRPVGSSFERGR